MVVLLFLYQIRNAFCINRKACAIFIEVQKQEGRRTWSRSAHWRTWSTSWRCWCSGNLQQLPYQ